MSLDLDDILAAAGPDRDSPCLVEVARVRSGPTRTVGFYWSTGRIRATVGPNWVRIKRKWGPMSDGLNSPPINFARSLRQVEIGPTVATTGPHSTSREQDFPQVTGAEKRYTNLRDPACARSRSPGA